MSARRTWRARWLAVLLAVVAAVFAVPTSALAEDGAVYVGSTNAADDTDHGATAEAPYASLKYAVEQANDGDTVYVMNDFEIDGCVVVWEKSVTISGYGADGQPITLTRAESFDTTSDTSRGWYNPAMFEVGGNAGHWTLTLNNIVLDDAGRRKEGAHFLQALSGGTPVTVNGVEKKVAGTDIVQDAIIASYDGHGSVTLGEGAVLKNFGGMSAVRITGGGTLTMLAGSAILDDMENINRDRVQLEGADVDYGVAGAVWLQGANLVMADGSEIRDINPGRGVYADGNCSVDIAGDFSGIVSTNQLWNGTTGIAIYARDNSEVSLGGTGYISVEPSNSSGQIVNLENADFTMDEGSEINGNNAKVYGLWVSGGSGNTVLINGLITGVNGAAAIDVNVDGSHPETSPVSAPKVCTIGESGEISGNINCWPAVVYMQTMGGQLNIQGDIINNTGNHTLWMADNYAVSTVDFGSTAAISNNSNSGSTIRLNKVTFIMDGGKISENEVSGDGPIVDVTAGSEFIIEGGEVVNNSSAAKCGAIRYTAHQRDLWINVDRKEESLSGWQAWIFPRAELNGGTISGNQMGGTEIDVSVAARGTSYYSFVGEDDYYDNHVTKLPYDTAQGEWPYQYIAPGAEKELGPNWLKIGPNMTLGNPDVYMVQGDFSLVNPDRDIKLGNASADAESAVTTALASKNLTTVVGSFWFQSDDAVESFTLTAPQKTDADGVLVYDSTKPVYAAIVGVGEDGLAPEGATVQLRPVTVGEDGNISVSVPSGSATGYAVVLVQETPQQPAHVVSVTPADMIVYVGGEDGYEGVVDGSGSSATTNSLPEPLFMVTLPDGVSAESLTFSNDGGNSWKLKNVGDGLYAFEPQVKADGGQSDPVRVQYSDGATVVTNDSFEVTSDVYNELVISVYAGEHGSSTKANDGATDYAIAQGIGTLTVRAVSTSPAISEVQPTAPSAEALETSSAVAVAPAGTVYTLNDTDVELPTGAKPSLLFDNIIDDTTNRTALLNEKIATLDGIEDDFKSQIKYLDLVDANNGNAWIAASNGVDVYWAYPEGMSASDSVKVFHFESLHRSGATSGFDPADIAGATVTEVTRVQKVAGGIMFHVDKASFSPFAVVWDYDGGNQGGGGTVIPGVTHTITASAGEGGSISPSGRVTVADHGSRSFSITADEGYAIQNVLIDGVNMGPRGSYTFTDVTEDHTISVTFTEGNAPADPDESGVSEWFDTDNHNAYLHGYGDGTYFGPENAMTRAEAAQMFYNLLRDKSGGDKPVTFEDVPEDAFYAEPVRVLASLGMLNGTSPTTYEPDRAITRAEFVAIAMRFSNGEVAGENIFTDVAEDAWYRDYVVGAVGYGWILGYQGEDATFGPDNPIARSQATTVANRMLGRVADGVWVASHLDDLKLFVDVPQTHFAFRDIVEATNSHEYERDGRYENWTGLVE